MKPTDFQLETFFKLAKLDVDIGAEVQAFYAIMLRTYPKLPPTFFESLGEELGEQYVRKEAFKLYRETFTKEEMDQLISFWSSSVGRKLVSKEFRCRQQDFIEKWSNEVKNRCFIADEKFYAQSPDPNGTGASNQPDASAVQQVPSMD